MYATGPQRKMSGEKFQSQDRTVVSVFEIVGSHFTSDLFNHVYNSARLKQSNGSSLTDEYRRQVNSFMLGIKNDKECYGSTISMVHKYFISMTRYQTLTFSGFVDRLVSTCIPEKYFAKMSTTDKDTILSGIICGLISDLAVYVTSADMLHRIIDKHDAEAGVTTRMIQDAAITSLLSKRSEYHNKFLGREGQVRDHVSPTIVVEMKKALRRLVKEKHAIAGELEESRELIDKYKKELKDYKKREEKMKKLIKLLHQGRDQGALAAGQSLMVPPRDTIAESRDPLAHVKAEPISRVPPRRDRIAESALPDDEEDEEDEEDEDDDGDDDEEADDGGRDSRARSTRRPAAAKKTTANARRGVSADFFSDGANGSSRVATGLTSAAAMPDLVEPVLATSLLGAGSGVSGAGNGGAGAGAGSRPAMMSRLMSDTDMSSTGDAAIDDLLGLAD
jgi:cell division protein FtsB